VRYRLAVLGQPLRHTRSPAIHNAALAALHLEGHYEAREVDPEGVKSAFAEVRSGALTGFNVTMPHKELAARCCDRLAEGADRAGSVNTVLVENGEVVGYSTDIAGIHDVWGPLPERGPVLILGAGGAAAAAVIALGSRPLYIATRRYGRGQALAARLGLDLGEVRWGVPVVGAVVVNCTPLGMGGEELPGDALDLASGLLDMAYGGGPTPAVQKLKERGRPVVEGLDLLVAQAARSFTLWTGRPAPAEVMRRAAAAPPPAGR
jgi:shikimate dehydrogenase